MKKILTMLLSLVLTIILVLLIAPMFYSLDELKPRIEAEVNAKVRGHVTVGHLSFSLFPSVKLGIEKVELKESKDAKAATFASVEKVQVVMPLWSLITAPTATLLVDNAKIKFVSDYKKGDSLKLFLLEPTPEEVAKEAADAKEAEKTASTTPLSDIQKQLSVLLKDVPAWISSRILQAKFSFELLNSEVDLKFVTQDLSLSKKLSDFEFKVLNIGFNSPVEVLSSGKVTAEMAGLKLAGPFDFKGAITMIPKEKGSSELKFQLTQNWNGLAIQAFDVLDKKAGTPLGVSLGGSVFIGEESKVAMNELSFVFGGVKTQGTLEATFKDTSAIQTNVLIKSDKIDLAELASLVPMVAQYKLKGQSSFSVKASGLATDPELAVDVVMSNISGSTPELAHPIEGLKGELTVRGKMASPSVELKNFSLKLGRSDLEVWMKSQGLEKINMNFGVKSKLLDVDQMMGLELAATDAKAGGAASTGGAASPKAVPSESLDEVLEEMAPMVEEQLKNEMLDKIAVKGSIEFQKIKVVGAEYTNAVVEMSLASRKLVVKSAELGAYEGKMNANLEMALNPGLLEYSLNAALDKISVGAAVAAHAPEWKDDISGELVGTFTLNGKGLRKAQLAKNLRGSLKGSMKDGQLKMPVLKTLSSVLDKLPGAAKEKVADSSLGNSEFRGEFKTMKVDSLIEGRKVILKNMDVVYDPQKAKIGDFRFQCTGELTFDKEIDFDATAMVSPELIRIAEWKGASGLVEIPLRLNGTMDEPKPDYDYTIKILTERLAKGAVKKEAKKAVSKVVDSLKKKAPAPVQKKIDDLKKKFKF